jgi:uncharacterized protein (TIGR02611 family)
VRKEAVLEAEPDVTVPLARRQPNPPRWLRPVRDRVRAVPGGRLVWTVLISVVGALMVAGGLALIPLPGPGWAIVFAGIAVWATEFVWAQRLLAQARAALRRWTTWALAQHIGLRIAFGILGLAVLAVLCWFLWAQLG